MAPDNSPRRSGALARSTAARMTAISVYTALAAGLLWWVQDVPTVVRIPVALPVLLFTPGYAVVTALLPPSSTIASTSRLERGILAVVASIAIVPMVVLATTAAGNIDFGLVLPGLTAITVVAAAIGAVRDSGADARSRRPYEGADRRSWNPVVTDGVTLVAITIAALLLVASAAVANTGGAGDQQMTEFYMVGENGTASGAPGIADGGDAAVYDLRIEHHSDEPQRYTVVVLLDSSGADSGTELDRTSAVVDPDETTAVTHRISRSRLDDGSTVRFLLYEGEAPSTPDPGTAHRVLEDTIGGGDE